MKNIIKSLAIKPLELAAMILFAVGFWVWVISTRFTHGTYTGIRDELEFWYGIAFMAALPIIAPIYLIKEWIADHRSTIMCAV